VFDDAQKNQLKFKLKYAKPHEYNEIRRPEDYHEEVILSDDAAPVPNNYFALPKHFDRDFAVPYNYHYNANCIDDEAKNVQSAITDLLYLNPHLSDESIKV
jgi:hypothetical protein